MFKIILDYFVPVFLLVPSYFILMSYKKASIADKIEDKVGVQFKTAKKSLEIYNEVNKKTYITYFVIYVIQVAVVIAENILKLYSKHFLGEDLLTFIIISYLLSILISYGITIMVSKKYE
ncbi:hypothetical protein [Oceanivirga miroungae]|uniref:Uncharacterized protein n=1 Tax=Oceanivirga miroungae TaxID=1130046 RepID=A0A6I8MDQ6_9FUSO|nr:hypothetical protein [Oceanivirga miroungae]VWL85646.1 hypothetical protein OMES3154_00931 [Oceanivirga miroungae]